MHTHTHTHTHTLTTTITGYFAYENNVKNKVFIDVIFSSMKLALKGLAHVKVNETPIKSQ